MAIDDQRSPMLLELRANLRREPAVMCLVVFGEGACVSWCERTAKPYGGYGCRRDSTIGRTRTDPASAMADFRSWVVENADSTAYPVAETLRGLARSREPGG